MHVSLRHLLVTSQIFLFAVIATPAHAQSSAAGTMAISAMVVNPLALIVTRPLDFGRFLASSSRTIAANSPTSGHFELLGQGGSAVTVTLTMPAQLNPTAGSNLPVTGWNYVVSDSPSLTGTPVAFNTGTTGPISVSFQSASGTTKIYFGIGATVTASAAQPTSAYTGTGQITAAYADL